MRTVPNPFAYGLSICWALHVVGGLACWEFKLPNVAPREESVGTSEVLVDRSEFDPVFPRVAVERPQPVFSNGQSMAIVAQTNRIDVVLSCAQQSASEVSRGRESLELETCAEFYALGMGCEQSDSRALAISADGAVVVGLSRQQFSEASVTLWNWRSGRIERLSQSGAIREREATTLFSAGLATSYNGTWVVGRREVRAPLLDRLNLVSSRGFKANANSIQDLFQGAATGVSGDGTVVVGWTEEFGQRRSVRVSPAGRVALESRSDGNSEARAVSQNGDWAVGFDTWPDGESRAVRWSAEGSIISLGLLAGDTSSVAVAVDEEGTTVVGSSEGLQGSHTFIWHQATNKVTSLPLEQVRAISGDGSRVVGVLNSQAAVWYANSAEVHILSELLDGVIPGGWSLTAATGISGDGRFVVGYGSSSSSIVEEAWIARLGNRCARVVAQDAGVTEDGGSATTN